MKISAAVLTAIIMGLVISVSAQVAKPNYELPAKFIKPTKWVEANKRTGTDVDQYGCIYPDSMDVQKALKIIDTEKDFLKLCQVKTWCLKNYQAIFPELIKRLTDTKEIGLNVFMDLHVLGREDYSWNNPMSTGSKAGIFVNEDVFTIAGRASWILNKITGEDFAEVRVTKKEEELQGFQKQWSKYIEDLKKE